MPVYLLHGFRWPREGMTGIRVHAIVNNLEDCSGEYIQNENSIREILGSFRKLYPELMRHLENPKTGQKLDFIEQYDPEDEFGPFAVSQPYAYIGDRVVMIAGGGPEPKPTSKAHKELPQENKKGKEKRVSFDTPRTNPKSPILSGKQSMTKLAAALSVNVEDVMSSGPAVTPEAWEALAELRDKLAEGQKIGWWVVYNGDPEREFDHSEDEEDEDENDNSSSIYEEEEAEEAQEEVEAEGAKTPTQEDVNLPVVSLSSATSRGMQHERDVPIRGSSDRIKSTSSTHAQHRQQQQQQAGGDFKRREAPNSSSSYRQSATSSLLSDASSRSKASNTTSSSSSAGGITAAPNKPSTKGREPPPVTLPPVGIRSIDHPSQQQQHRGATASNASSIIAPSDLSDEAAPAPSISRRVESSAESYQQQQKKKKTKDEAKKEGLRRKFFGKKS